MSRRIIVGYTPYGHYITKKKYGFGAFLFDAILTILTLGLWLVFLIIQKLRGR